MSRDIGRRRHRRRSGSTRHETNAATRSQLGPSDPLVLRRQRSDLAESTRSASQIPPAEARTTSLPQSSVPISCSRERPWRSRAHNQHLRSDQIAIAPVAPACPNYRDFVPWRFSDADRARVGRAQHLGVRETCTPADSCTATRCRSAPNPDPSSAPRSAKPSGAKLRCAPPALVLRPHNLEGGQLFDAWSTIRCRLTPAPPGQ